MIIELNRMYVFINACHKIFKYDEFMFSKHGIIMFIQYLRSIYFES